MGGPFQFTSVGDNKIERHLVVANLQQQQQRVVFVYSPDYFAQQCIVYTSTLSEVRERGRNEDLLLHYILCVRYHCVGVQHSSERTVLCPGNRQLRI